MKIVDSTVGPKTVGLSVVPNGVPFKYTNSKAGTTGVYIKLGTGGLNDSIKKLLEGTYLAMDPVNGNIAVFPPGEHFVTEYDGVLNLSWKTV